MLQGSTVFGMVRLNHQGWSEHCIKNLGNAGLARRACFQQTQQHCFYAPVQFFVRGSVSVFSIYLIKQDPFSGTRTKLDGDASQGHAQSYVAMQAEAASVVKTACLVNLANCAQREQQFGEALDWCNKALR